MLALVFVITVIAGCSNESEDRNAALLYKDTSVCIINDSASRTEVRFTAGDQVSDDKILWENMGDKACGAGTSGGGIIDVRGEFITTNPIRTWYFGTGNRPIRAPGINVGYLEDGAQYSCISQEFSENESRVFDDGYVTVTATRLPDTDTKNFEVRITDTTNPSASGEARTC
jgi:hypothetical protein